MHGTNRTEDTGMPSIACRPFGAISVPWRALFIGNEIERFFPYERRIERANVIVPKPIPDAAVQESSP